MKVLVLIVKNKSAIKTTDGTNHDKIGHLFPLDCCFAELCPSHQYYMVLLKSQASLTKDINWSCEWLASEICPYSNQNLLQTTNLQPDGVTKNRQQTGVWIHLENGELQRGFSSQALEWRNIKACELQPWEAWEMSFQKERSWRRGCSQVQGASNDILEDGGGLCHQFSPPLI